MIGTYKLIKGRTVTHKVESNDDSEMCPSSPRPPLLREQLKGGEAGGYLGQFGVFSNFPPSLLDNH